MLQSNLVGKLWGCRENVLRFCVLCVAVLRYCGVAVESNQNILEPQPVNYNI